MEALIISAAQLLHGLPPNTMLEALSPHLRGADIADAVYDLIKAILASLHLCKLPDYPKPFGKTTQWALTCVAL